MRRAPLLCLLALAGYAALAAPGCTSGVGLASPRAMNHPVDVAFACFDTSVPGSPVVVPLSNCALQVDVTSNTRQPPLNPGFHMHALVTQLTRGEVGAVDLIARTVLDSDTSVPGYTFVAVGELPTTIAVRPSDGNGEHRDPVCTYVASRGPVDGRHPGISIIDTRRFRSGAGLTHDPFPTFAPYVLPSAPADMVLAPDEQSLWVTLDAIGVLVRVPILSSCSLGPIDLVVPLYEDVPAGRSVTLAPPTPTHVPGTTIDLTRTCPLPSRRVGAFCATSANCPDGLPCQPTTDGLGYCAFDCDLVDGSRHPCPGGTPCNTAFTGSSCFALCADDSECEAGRQCWGNLCQPACVSDAECGAAGTCSSGRCVARTCTADGDCMGAGTCGATGSCHITGPMPPPFVAQPVAPETVGPRPTMFDSSLDAEPATIAFDLDAHVILVADRGLPLIHRVNMADGTLLGPIPTGVPVRDIALTPRVPDSYALAPDPLAGTCGGMSPRHIAGAVVPAPDVTFSRYVYAIDDTDGTVMAIEYTDPNATCDTCAVIPIDVNGAQRPDRIGMPVVARALEIITPQYDTTADDPRFAPDAAGCIANNRYGFGLCLPSEPASTAPPSPQVLRGVFLVVTAADGSVRLVDVYDLDAPCRGRLFGAVPVDFANGVPNGECNGAPTVTGDIDLYVRRHRPRVQQILSSFVTIDSGPSVFLPAGGSVVLGTNGRAAGQTADSNIPSLVPLDACPSPLASVWGEPAPVVCSLTDPFAAITETWSATFEGPIPGTFTSSANAETTGPDGTGFTGVIDTRIDYCLRGVIGREQAESSPYPAGDPEHLYHGDMLVLTGTMPAANIESMAICRSVLGINNVGEQGLPILARIRSAFTSPPDQHRPYTGRLFVDPTTPIEDRVGTPPTMADAIQCFGDMLLTIEVRSYNAFTVSGTRTGYHTRIVRSADGTCAYDPMNDDALTQGHAFSDVTYRNHRIVFRPTGVAHGRTISNELAEIRMVLTGGPSQLGLDLSLGVSGTRSMALPTGLRYSPEMWALYAIEAERGGLIEMTLRPLARTQTAYQ